MDSRHIDMEAFSNPMRAIGGSLLIYRHFNDFYFNETFFTLTCIFDILLRLLNEHIKSLNKTWRI